MKKTEEERKRKQFAERCSKKHEKQETTLSRTQTTIKTDRKKMDYIHVLYMCAFLQLKLPLWFCLRIQNVYNMLCIAESLSIAHTMYKTR